MFGAGTGNGPKSLMDRDLVFVTFNYRLGPLGKIINLSPNYSFSTFYYSYHDNGDQVWNFCLLHT